MKGSSGKRLERREESGRESFHHLRDHIVSKPDVGSMNVRGACGEDSGGSGECGIRHWRAGGLCSKVTESLAGLHLAFGRKGEFVSNELGYSTEEISKQTVEGTYSLVFPGCLW